MEITTWRQAKDAGLTQESLQQLCDYDTQLAQRIEASLRKKHPNASDKQIACWVNNCMHRKFQREHWGYSNLDIIKEHNSK